MDKDPHWKDSFEVSLIENQLIKISFWDENLVKDSFIGEATVNAFSLANQKINETIQNVKRNGKCIGQYLLFIEPTPVLFDSKSIQLGTNLPFKKDNIKYPELDEE